MVFISHSKYDRKAAEALCVFLESKGVLCWVSFRDITSGNFSGEITRALRASDVVVVVCSKKSCRSEHVKNEVTLAFNQGKHIIPYLLEDNPYDDDLEYFLSNKQYIKSQGSYANDFPIIVKSILDYRGESAIVSPEETVVHKNSNKGVSLAVVMAVLAFGICAAAFILRDKVSKEDVFGKAPKDASEAVTGIVTTNNNTFTGPVKNGYPDGFGTFTFGTRRRIDIHDNRERYAEPGDYIKGDWKQGHLNYGEWYSADGTKKEFIRLGDNPDTGADQKLGTCIKR